MGWSLIAPSSGRFRVDEFQIDRDLPAVVDFVVEKQQDQDGQRQEQDRLKQDRLRVVRTRHQATQLLLEHALGLFLVGLAGAHPVRLATAQRVFDLVDRVAGNARDKG